MARTPTTIALDDGIIVGVEQEGGWSGRRCTWPDSVCSELPTHYVRHPSVRPDELTIRFLCERHFVLTLAELVEVHLPQCDAAASDHVEGFGTIASLDQDTPDSPK